MRTLGCLHLTSRFDNTARDSKYKNRRYISLPVLIEPRDSSTPRTSPLRSEQHICLVDYSERTLRCFENRN